MHVRTARLPIIVALICLSAFAGATGNRPGPSALPTPCVRVRLSRTLYRIHVDPKTGAPIMPSDVTASADIVAWPSGAPPPRFLTWHVFLDWDNPAYPTNHPLDSVTYLHPSPLKIDFGDSIRGGTLTVYVKVVLGERTITGMARAQVRGENPDRTMVLRAFPRSRFGLMASKIGMAESCLKQFTEPTASDPGGLPAISRTRDIGLMQLNVPTGGITSADQVWDWRANVKRGLEMLAGKRRTSMLVSRRMAAAPERSTAVSVDMPDLGDDVPLVPIDSLFSRGIPPLGDAPGSGSLPGDLDTDRLNLSQSERDAIRRYNGGQEYVYVVRPALGDPTLASAGWEIDPTRGGIDPAKGDPDYVRHVLAAHSGLDISPASSGPVHRTARVRHRHHRRSHRASRLA